MSMAATSTVEGRDMARGHGLRAAVRVEILTVIWMTGEAAIAIAAGVIAGSLLLTAFGVDSVIELLSGSVVLRRLLREAQGHSRVLVEVAERRAAWLTGSLLALLCLYVTVMAAVSLVTRHTPEASVAGIVLAAAAVIAMPILSWWKRRIASVIDCRLPTWPPHATFAEVIIGQI